MSSNLLNEPTSRRWFLTAGAAFSTLPFTGGYALAYGSQTHVTTLGDMQLTVISDGHMVFPTNIVAVNVPKEELDAYFKEAFGAVPQNVMPETNHLLIRTGQDLVLIDNGSGRHFQPTAGKLLENLKINGIDPKAVTKVVFTHAHPDHVWGTVLDDGGLMLPNATYYMGSTEHKFWTSPDVFSQLPADFAPMAKSTQQHLGAIGDRLQLVKGGDSIVSGISVLETPGHTPGHISLLLEQGQGMIVTGDAVTSELLTLAHPEWHSAFDAMPDMAVKARKTLLDRAATDRLLIQGYHFTYPGIGHVERRKDAYHFIPVST